MNQMETRIIQRGGILVVKSPSESIFVWFEDLVALDSFEEDASLKDFILSLPYECEAKYFFVGPLAERMEDLVTTSKKFVELSGRIRMGSRPIEVQFSRDEFKLRIEKSPERKSPGPSLFS